MKHLPTIAGGLLGLAFIVFGLNFFMKFLPIPPPPADTPAAAFMGALFGSGFLAFVKVLEILGGILVAIPKTRNFGLLILVPIIVNIWAYHVFLARDGIWQPPLIVMTILAAFLLWSARGAIAGLMVHSPSPPPSTEPTAA